VATVFVSYRSADATSARKLSRDLERAGHTVWLDTEQIAIGDSLVERIDAGLADATYLVLCLAPGHDTSAWTRREWMSTLARQLAGKHVKVLPARLVEADVPAVIADLRVADLATDWNRGVADLLAAMT